MPPAADVDHPIDDSPPLPATAPTRPMRPSTGADAVINASSLP